MTTAEPRPSPRLRILDSARAIASSMTLEACPLETGGILLGWHEGDAVVVSHVLQVGDRRASSHGYVRNDESAQRALDDFLATSPDDRIGYVGEWHSHPVPMPPSDLDCSTLRELAEDTGYQVALAVFSVSLDGSVTPYLATAIRNGKQVTLHRLGNS